VDFVYHSRLRERAAPRTLQHVELSTFPSEMSDITADSFVREFLSAYADTRGRFLDPEDWEKVFPREPWTKVVLRTRDDPMGTLARGAPILVQVADRLGLHYVQGNHCVSTRFSHVVRIGHPCAWQSP
jgi:hypothetical protein